MSPSKTIHKRSTIQEAPLFINPATRRDNHANVEIMNNEPVLKPKNYVQKMLEQNTLIIKLVTNATKTEDYNKVSK